MLVPAVMVVITEEFAVKHRIRVKLIPEFVNSSISQIGINVMTGQSVTIRLLDNVSSKYLYM